MINLTSGRVHASHVTSDESSVDDTLLRNSVLWGVRDREWGELVRAGRRGRSSAERAHGVCVCVCWWLEQVEAQTTAAPHTVSVCLTTTHTHIYIYIYTYADKHMHTDGTTPEQHKLHFHYLISNIIIRSNNLK